MIDELTRVLKHIFPQYFIVQVSEARLAYLSLILTRVTSYHWLDLARRLWN
jgi:hypothetical protein